MKLAGKRIMLLAGVIAGSVAMGAFAERKVVEHWGTGETETSKKDERRWIGIAYLRVEGRTDFVVLSDRFSSEADCIASGEAWARNRLGRDWHGYKPEEEVGEARRYECIPGPERKRGGGHDRIRAEKGARSD